MSSIKKHTTESRSHGSDPRSLIETNSSYRVKCEIRPSSICHSLTIVIEGRLEGDLPVVPRRERNEEIAALQVPDENDLQRSIGMGKPVHQRSPAQIRATLARYLSQLPSNVDPGTKTQAAFNARLQEQRVLDYKVGGITNAMCRYFVKGKEYNAYLFVLQAFEGVEGEPEVVIWVEYGDLRVDLEDGQTIHFPIGLEKNNCEFSFDEGRTWKKVFSPKIAVDDDANIIFVNFRDGTLPEGFYGGLCPNVFVDEEDNAREHKRGERVSR